MNFNYEPEEINTQDLIEFLLWMSTNPGQFGRRGMPHPGFREWLAAHDAEVRDELRKEIAAQIRAESFLEQNNPGREYSHGRVSGLNRAARIAEGTS